MFFRFGNLKPVFSVKNGEAEGQFMFNCQDKIFR